MLAFDLGLGGCDMLLNSGVATQQDVPAVLADVAVLVELVGILIRVEDNVSGCDEVDLAGVERAGDEESASSLDGWGNFCADGETEGSGERLSSSGGSVGGGDRLVHLGTGGGDDHRLTNFDMDIDIMRRKDTLAVSHDLNAPLGRKGVVPELPSTR